MESSLDWLTLTLTPENKAIPSEENYARALDILRDTLLLDELFTMLEFKGVARFYGVRLEYDDVNIKIADPEKFNRQGLCIELSSNGLKYFTEYLATYGLTLRLWCARFRALCTEGWITKCTRYDFAMDDICHDDDVPKLTMKRVLTSICDDEIVCSARTYSDDCKDYISFKRNYKRRNGQGLWGTTVYLGQRESGLIVRFYDKKIEQEQKGKTLPENLKSWVRCEFEFHNEKATACFNAFIDLPPEDFKKYMCGVCNGSVRFIYRTVTNVSRCPVKRWWREFLNGCTDRFHLPKRKPIRTALARCERGIRQYTRKFYTLLRQLGSEGFLKMIMAFGVELAQKGKEVIDPELVNNLREHKRDYEEIDGFKWYDYTTEVSDLRGKIACDRYEYN